MNDFLKIQIFFETIFIEISYCFVASEVCRCVLRGICPGVREPKLYHQTRSSFFVDVQLFHGKVVHVFKHENDHKFSFFPAIGKNQLECLLIYFLLFVFCLEIILIFLKICT